MGLRLKSNNKTIPAGIVFTDLRTGRVFNPYQDGLDMTVRKIIEHRAANKTYYPATESGWFDAVAVRQEVLRVVQRSRPDMFQEYIGGPIPPVRSAVAPLPGPKLCECGSDKFDPVYCPTCSGQRVTGWKCTKCGKIRSR